VKAPSDSLRARDLRAAGLIVLEGSFLVERGIETGLEVKELFCVPEARGRWEAASKGACPMRVLPERELSDILGYPFHRGAFALASRPPIPKSGGEGSPPLPEGDLLCFWQVTDPDNLGALLRSGAALGAKAALLGPGCADPFYPKSLRASMGAALALPLFEAGAEDIPSINRPPRVGVAAALGGLPPAEARASLEAGSSVCLFLGNEGWGLPPEALEACPIKIEIPMSGLTDSLNVAAAGAILMWELFGKGAGGAPGEPPATKRRER
jgi:RNA methyltransferase, TrmH family